MFKVLFCVLIIGFNVQKSFGTEETNPLPIVLWHGMGKRVTYVIFNCINVSKLNSDILGDSSFYSLGSFKSFLQQNLGPNSYVTSIRIGKNVAEDRKNSFLMHPNKQVEQACRIIKSDPKLKDGYNAIGFSQGAQFL